MARPGGRRRLERGASALLLAAAAGCATPSGNQHIGPGPCGPTGNHCPPPTPQCSALPASALHPSLTYDRPSELYPPNYSNWYPNSVGGSALVCMATRIDDPYRQPRVVEVAELRGWVHHADGCNIEDPDWHLLIEPDLAWAAQQGYDVSRLLLVGNVINFAADRQQTGSYYRSVGTPYVNVELNGWRHVPVPGPGHGVPPPPPPPPPKNWFQIASCATNDQYPWPMYWAFDPTQPAGAPIEGRYVRMVGSLVADGIHVVGATADLEPLPGVGSDDFQNAKKVWMNCRHTLDDCTNTEKEDIPARWTEMHPPDRIEILDSDANPTPRTETDRSIALAADNGAFSGDTQSLETDIAPPGPQPPGRTAAVQEIIDGITNYGTITGGNCGAQGCSGAKVDVFADHAHVMVQVHGSGGYGAPGKYKATYRVFWALCGCDGHAAAPGGGDARCLPPTCAAGQTCEQGLCVACTPQIVQAHCGSSCNRPDGCGGTCACGVGNVCVPLPLIGGVCAVCSCTTCGRSTNGCNCVNRCPSDKPDCAPDGGCTCLPKCKGACGGQDDGCGGTCVSCPAGQNCDPGTHLCTRPPSPCPAGQAMCGCTDPPGCLSPADCRSACGQCPKGQTYCDCNDPPSCMPAAACSRACRL